MTVELLLVMSYHFSSSSSKTQSLSSTLTPIATNLTDTPCHQHHLHYTHVTLPLNLSRFEGLKFRPQFCLLRILLTVVALGVKL